MVIVVGGKSDAESTGSLSGIHGKRMVGHPAAEKHPLMPMFQADTDCRCKAAV
jgi:hypothetical protein